MNTNTASTPPPLPDSLQPMEGRITIVNLIENLLRHPARLLYECTRSSWQVLPLLIIVTALSLSVFGFLLGTFSGGVQLWAAPLKVAFGTLAAVIICLPSLYIFGALGGLEARLSQIAGVLLTMSPSSDCFCLDSLPSSGSSPPRLNPSVFWAVSRSSSG